MTQKQVTVAVCMPAKMHADLKRSATALGVPLDSLCVSRLTARPKDRGPDVDRLRVAMIRLGCSYLDSDLAGDLTPAQRATLLPLLERSAELV